MDRQRLFDLWRENNDRPQWVHNHRDEIHEYVDTSEPIPSGGVAAVSRWLDRFKGTVTKQLDDAEGDDE